MLKIGEFANLFNISIKTIRFYEEKELFKPYYIDKYTGYRYYDAKNIDEMSRILYLKNLGFSLDEIKNYDEKLLIYKIEMYKNQIIKLKSNITILESLNINEDINENKNGFINDVEAIGKWKLIGLSNTREEAENQNFDNSINFNIKDLYFLENGQPYWIISWSKNKLFIRGIENRYEIEDDLMYVEILYPEDKSIYMVAVYKKEDSKKYTVDEIKKKDKFYKLYHEDYKLIGFWKTVDYIKLGQRFNYKVKRAKNSELSLKRITVNPEDNTAVIFLNNGENIITKYTKNYILNVFEKNTVCRYEYRRINRREYIFLENKNEDYMYGQKLDGYYVLEKVGGNFMENVFEKREINTILSEEKNGLLLGKNIYLPNDKRGNINTLVVAGSGAGKSASFIVPNILNMLGSYVITDPLGEVYEKTYKYLENNGYEVKVINYNSKNEYKYNPLNHINSDNDVDTLADILIGDDSDEFWNESAKCLMKTVIYYVLEKAEKKDLLTVFYLLSTNKDELFKKFEEFAPCSKGQKYAALLKTFPDKTYASTVSTAIVKLSFVINKVADDRNYAEKFDFKELFNKKMAIYVVFNENNKEDRKMANILISQMLSQFNITKEAVNQNVYFLLNCVGMIGKINELSTYLSASRGKKISISLVLNAFNNLKSIYGDEFYSMLSSIDTQMLLGTNLKSDMEYFSDLLGIDDEFIKNDLEKDKLLIFEKGLKPILADKDYFFMHEEWNNI
jgi:DNA-binding transcriptional MerR regulator